MTEQRPPLPPFTFDTAVEKVRKAEDAWNTRQPNVALAYTPDSIWRNRTEFIKGREEIMAFLTRKWHRESRLSFDQGALDLSRQPHRRALRL